MTSCMTVQMTMRKACTTGKQTFSVLPLLASQNISNDNSAKCYIISWKSIKCLLWEAWSDSFSPRCIYVLTGNRNNHYSIIGIPMAAIFNIFWLKENIWEYILKRSFETNEQERNPVKKKNQTQSTFLFHKKRNWLRESYSSIFWFSRFL